MADGITLRNKILPAALHQDLVRDYKIISTLDHIQELLNSYPHISAVINQRRQIIYSNQHLVKLSGVQNLEQIISELPGDAIHCTNTSENIHCGLSQGCKFCGIQQTINKSQALGIRTTGECRITASHKGNLIFYDFQVTCSPLSLSGESYTLLHLVDISSEKRNAMLENVFFHDVLNRLGGLTGIIQIMKMENKQPEINEYIDLLDTIGELVIEDIQTRRYLKAAENADLMLNIRNHSSLEIMESIQKQIAFHTVLKSRTIMLCTDREDFTIKTDGALLKRILLNMTKNAAEASPENGIIKLLCCVKNGKAVFSVYNPGVIPDDVRLQIFQRSFSTKGSGRGLGTYSMKLFGENYLNGKVYFRSDEKKGTTFTIELPLGKH